MVGQKIGVDLTRRQAEEPPVILTLKQPFHIAAGTAGVGGRGGYGEHPHATKYMPLITRGASGEKLRV